MSARGGGAESAAPTAAGPLSARRVRALTLVSEVVPSAYGAPGEAGERWKKLAPGYESHLADDGKTVVQTDHGVVLPDGFTTCGYLPCFVGRGLELEKSITQCGLEALRTNARAWGAWVEPSSGKAPRSGDVYGIDHSTESLIVHVGIIVGPDETADAGQGDHLHQKAERVKRALDLRAGTIGGPLGPRRLAGWVDLDRVPLASAALAAKKPRA